MLIVKYTDIYVCIAKVIIALQYAIMKGHHTYVLRVPFIVIILKQFRYQSIAS